MLQSIECLPTLRLLLQANFMSPTCCYHENKFSAFNVIFLSSCRLNISLIRNKLEHASFIKIYYWSNWTQTCKRQSVSVLYSGKLQLGRVGTLKNDVEELVWSANVEVSTMSSNETSSDACLFMNVDSCLCTCN